MITLAVPGEEANLFQPGADAKAAWELGRLGQLWRFAQAYRLTGDGAWGAGVARLRAALSREQPRGVRSAVVVRHGSEAKRAAFSFALVQAEVDAGLLLDFLEEHCA